jgi:signal transduction histidine kinase
MQLADDGRGFEMEKVSQMNGLTNMQSRASRIKSELIIGSQPGQGTEVRLLLPDFKKQLV